MFKAKALVVLAAIAATAGCSSRYQVKLDSTPQGATVVCSGTDQGYTPVTVYYDKGDKKQPYIDASNCSAKWSSGVNATYPARLKVSSESPTEFTLPRPAGPGYQKDARFALKIKNKKQDKKFSETDSTGKNHSSNMLCSYVGGMKTCL